MEEIKSPEGIPSGENKSEETQSEKKDLIFRPALKPKPNDYQRIRRVSFDIRTSAGQVFHGRLFVSYSMTHEISALGLRFFCTREMISGTDIEIILTDGQKPLKLNARVLWCKAVDINPTIISQDSYRFRVEAMFIAADSKSREQLMDYSKQIFEHYLGVSV